MSKMQENISPQEKEKLRKRLQKLFQNQVNVEEPAAGGKSGKKNTQHKNKRNNPQKEGKLVQQVTANKLKQYETTPKNVKKQQQSNKKKVSTSDETSKQNGFVKSANPVTGKQDFNNSAKQISVEKKVKSKETKLQHQKTYEFPQPKASPSQQTQPKKAKTKTVNKIKKDVKEIFKQKTNVKSAENKKKSQQNFQNASVITQQSVNGQQLGQTSTFKQTNATTNAETKITNNHNKKDKKRTASENISIQEPPTTSKKKTKLSKNSNKTNEMTTLSKQKRKTEADLSVSPSSQIEDEFDVSGLTEYVRGGDLDSDSEEQKFSQTSTFKQTIATTNAETKFTNNQNKKAKKRTVYENLSIQEPPTTSKKKPKLSKNSNKTSEMTTLSKQKHKTEADLSVSPSSQIEDEFDVSGWTEYVRCGDLDSDSEEDDMDYNYWMQQEEFSSDNDDSAKDFLSSEDDNDVQTFKNNSETKLEQYYHNAASGSEEEYFDSGEDEDGEFDYYYGDDSDEEKEEEDETYSDSDESDYEVDEDFYNYIDDDGCTHYTTMSPDSNNNEDDDDYKLPNHIPEDIIIHKGTAIKRDLKPEDNVAFDSDNEKSQIVELEVQNNVKVVYQAEAYKKEELLKLKYEEKTMSSITYHKKEPIPSTETSSDTVDCPKLLPIVDENGFQLYNPNKESDDEVQVEMVEEDVQEHEDDDEQSYENESMDKSENDDMDDVSLGSEYMEINSDDDDSFLSEDINEKYLNRGHNDSESDYSIDEDMWNRQHKVDVIDATGYKCEEKADSKKDHSDISLNDDIKQIPSLKLYENVDLKTESTILSTIIIDKELFKSIDNIEQELSNESKEVAEEPATEIKILPQYDIMEESLEKEDNSTEESVEKPVPTAKVVKPTGQSLVDYSTKFFNALDSNLVAVLLKDPFYIYGTVRLTLLAGKVKVYGHSLSLNTEVEIFSPRGCSVIKISPSSLKNKMSKQELKNTLKSYEKHFALADLKRISDAYNSETDAVVLLKRNEARKKVVQQFKKFMNENVFPNINNINVDRPLYNTEYLLRCMINTSAQEQKCLRLPKQWKEINITPQSRVMLTGGKGVGKSTLLRYLINRHLPQQILLIDLDIGQPEVFVPQTVSCTIVKQPLLGPGFMLNLQPEISYAVGHTNIALCAHKYIAAVCSLITHCKAQEAYKDIPWLINTMGYNKGFGLELISVIAQELSLTDVIQLQSSKEINNFDCILHDHVLSNIPSIMFSLEDSAGESLKEQLNYRLHVWQSAVQQESRYQKDWEMSAKDLRYAILLARLSEALQGHAEWLTDVKPLSASLNDLKIINLMANTAEESKEELAKSVEANLVYLCHHQADNNPIRCLGIGVVRAVDFHVQQLYLIPAIPYTQLKEINCVAIGEMPLPSSLFTNQGSIVKNTAPFVYNTIAANTSKAIKQIYHRPREFLTGKHKSLD